MRSNMWLGLVAGLAVACGGQTFQTGNGGDGGASSSSGSGSGGSGGSTSGSGGGSGGGSGSSGSSGSGGSGSGGSSGGGSSSGVADGGPGPLCPTSPPAIGAPCPRQGLQCEYGTDPNPNCDEMAECGNGTWSFSSTEACPSGTCPGTYPGSAKSVPCSPEGLDCSYPEGQCNCALEPLEDPTEGPSWLCSDPGVGCPEPRADLGTPCTQEGEQCDYGACTGGIAEQCTGGVWTEELTACPATAGSQ
jgi:hypothetical protein